MEKRTHKNERSARTRGPGVEPSIVPPLALGVFEQISLRMLLPFCNSTGIKTEAQIDAETPTPDIDTEDYITLTARFGHDLIPAGLRVLDAGCGFGDLAIAMARAGAEIVGVDIDGARIRLAREKAQRAGVADRAVFVHQSFLDYEPKRLFDRIVSIEAFEHIPEPERYLPKMRGLLAPEGKILSSFGPLWLSPYGPHQYGFTKFPWVHLAFPERVVLTARRKTFRPTDPATRYEDIRGGLNRMTVGRFRRAAYDAGLRFDRFAYNPQLSNPAAKLMSTTLTAIPGMREFFAHTVLCVMRSVNAAD